LFQSPPYSLPTSLTIACSTSKPVPDPSQARPSVPNLLARSWAKSTIFINGPVSALLKDAGNIPVDRKNKDNQKLFAGTFDVLKLGEVVAIFPEGTSYTEPSLQTIKEGASWAALEYGKNIREVDTQSKAKDVQIVVASIVYTNKTKYRERAIVTCVKPALQCKGMGMACASKTADLGNIYSSFNKPIDTTAYAEEFMNEPKTAVKKLTAKIKQQMHDLTINAPDWYVLLTLAFIPLTDQYPCQIYRDTLRAAETARELLWGDNAHVPLSDWTSITQSLVNLFSSSSAKSITDTKQALVEYEALLRTLHYTNSSLNALPLPRILDPAHPSATPARFSSLFALLKTTFSSLIFLPFFILPLLTHIPIYTIGKWTAYKMNTDEPEQAAQNKIVFSLLFLLFIIYPSIFFFTWAIFLFTPLGFIVAVMWLGSFAYYHNRLIDANYSKYKKLVASWRILVGLWLGSSDPDQNQTRKLLKYRARAADKVASLMLELESRQSDEKKIEGWNEGNVDWFRSLGAKLVKEGGRGNGRASLTQEADSSGRLKQT